MRVLIVKTSSLGDVIHALPAVTDAARALDVRFDWVVEEAFAEVPAWHPAVDRVIPVALRRWRKDWRGARESGEWATFLAALRAREYAAVIDAQGLIKSAWLARKARGPLHGLAWRSAREPLATFAYRHRHRVSWRQHAVSRVRQLFAASLGYSLTPGLPDYGLSGYRPAETAADSHGSDEERRPYLLFLHGTTWVTKHYPEAYWVALIGLAVADGFDVRLPWGNDAERARAERLAVAADENPAVTVLPRLDLAGIAAQIRHARGVVAVDTGLSHLAAAFGVPQVALYGATDPARTGAYGRAQFHFKSDFPCAPCLRRQCAYRGVVREFPGCYDRLPPDEVFATLLEQIGGA